MHIQAQVVIDSLFHIVDSIHTTKSSKGDLKADSAGSLTAKQLVSEDEDENIDVILRITHELFIKRMKQFSRQTEFTKPYQKLF